MTQLILKPFDPKAKGSHAQRMRMLELADAYQQAQDTQDGTAIARIAIKINQLVTPRLRTDDGTPVADALDEVSADEYDTLVQGLFAVAGADSVPLPSTPTSTEP